VGRRRSIDESCVGLMHDQHSIHFHTPPPRPYFVCRNGTWGSALGCRMNSRRGGWVVKSALGRDGGGISSRSLGVFCLARNVLTLCCVCVCVLVSVLCSCMLACSFPFVPSHSLSHTYTAPRRHGFHAGQRLWPASFAGRRLSDPLCPTLLRTSQSHRHILVPRYPPRHAQR
jgi:hypothetical protein